MFDSSRSVRSRSQRLQATSSTERRAATWPSRTTPAGMARILVERVTASPRYTVTLALASGRDQLVGLSGL